MFLLDTNVISETDPVKAKTATLKIDPDAELFLTSITIAELEAGVCKLERTGATRKAANLRDWLNNLERRFAGRILPFNLDAAKIAGRLRDKGVALGHDPGLADIQIAAIAAARDLVVLTRNVRHFEPLGVPYRDPFIDA